MTGKQGELGAMATSYKTAVMNGREQLGDRREVQQSRIPNGGDGNKGKGVARDKMGAPRYEAAHYKHKDIYHRGNGEGSSVNGRQLGSQGPQVYNRGYTGRLVDTNKCVMGRKGII